MSQLLDVQNDPDYQQARALFTAGRLEQTEAACRAILTRAPHHHGALHLLGLLAYRVRRWPVAAEYVSRALALQPSNAAYNFDLAESYVQMGLVMPALKLYRQTIALRPSTAEAWTMLGAMLCEVDALDDALQAGKKAVELAPQLAGAWNNLGSIYRAHHMPREAEDAYRRALAINPDLSEIWRNLGDLLLHAGRPLALGQKKDPLLQGADPALASRLRGQAYAFLDQARVSEAAAALRDLIDQSGCATVEDHWDASLLLLTAGDFKRGWKEYEYRWKVPGFPSPMREFATPLWTGQDLTGKTILLHTEQGLGDAIQFVRYAVLVKARGARVLLEAKEELVQVLTGAAGIDAVYARGAELPAFDFHCPLLSLPGNFGTTLETIPQKIGYLRASEHQQARWRAWLAQRAQGKITVGLVWAGRPTHWSDHLRSITLKSFAPLWEISDVTFVSLQKGPAAAQIAHAGVPILNPMDEIGDLSQTAALISNLHLVISVDTVIVHLAGAIGVPVWTLVAHVPDWRWLLDRTDTPWYPTMRLWRQDNSRHWEPLIKLVSNALQQFATSTYLS